MIPDFSLTGTGWAAGDKKMPDPVAEEGVAAMVTVRAMEMAGGLLGEWMLEDKAAARASQPTSKPELEARKSSVAAPKRLCTVAGWHTLLTKMKCEAMALVGISYYRSHRAWI